MIVIITNLLKTNILENVSNYSHGVKTYLYKYVYNILNVIVV